MIVDENRRGWPAAHLITSKSDSDTLQYFFQAVKSRLPDHVKINCVITDDDPALINAMNMGFSENLRHILCKRHLMKSFKDNLRSKAARNNVDLMITELKVIINAKEESLFVDLLNGFIKKYEHASSGGSEFVSYLKKYYVNRAHKWAMCYRNFFHSDVNTTGHIESFHHRLKKCYLKRKVNKRLDDLANILLEVEWDDHLTKIREKTIGTAYLPQDILERHKRGMTLSDGSITDFEENTWEVDSSSKKLKYVVCRYLDKCSSDLCFSCCSMISCAGLCSHMYTCSCPDSHPLCKHIHKVHTFLCRDIAKTVSNDSYSDVQDHCVDSEAVCYTVDRIPTFSQQKSTEAMSRNLQENLSYLTDFFMSAYKFPNALSHAVAISGELVNRLRHMTSEQPADVAFMEPALKFNSNEKLKTQVLQVPSFRKILGKRKRDIPLVTHHQKRAVVTNLLSQLSDTSNTNADEEKVDNDLEELLPVDSNDLGESAPENSKHTLCYNFTPPLSSVSNARDILLKYGLETISLINLKSLELSLPDEERKLYKSLDPILNVEWLYSCIINVYLLKLSDQYPLCHAFSSDLANRGSRETSNINSIKRIVDGNKKKILFFPANLSGTHWVIIAVFLAGDPQVKYYDPLQCKMSNAAINLVIQINEDLKSIYPSLSDWDSVFYVEMEKQPDVINCGVHICAFAQQSASRSEYSLISDIRAFRNMYDLIVGGCLKLQNKEEECGECQDTYSNNSKEDNSPWISCSVCEQWFHLSCVSMTSNTSKSFVCPK